jgi:Domain of unknown function (DUF4189)
MGHRWMILVPVFGFAVALMPAPARADCMSSCSSSYTPNVFPNDWYSRLTSCQQSCALHPQPASTAYGALAYGKDSTAWGFSYGQSSAAVAAKVALDQCKPNGDDCRVVYNFSNTCAALAAVEEKGVYAAAHAASRRGAEQAAIAACTRDNGDGCVMEVSTCSLP